MDTDATRPKPALPHLPWLIAAGAFVFFLFTVNWGLTLPGLAALPRITGWDWELNYAAPLLFLVTYPFRWLPDGMQVPAVNLMAVICASLTLALLARSVALLPHDRTREQRQQERSDFSFLSIRFSWAPVLFAVLVCGLQFTFWLHAIVNTGEAFDLLCFAYIIRCLLEARVDERESWLTKMAFVYGLAITNNFALIGFLPLFLGALIWIKGYRLLDSGLIVQIVLWGLAGLLLYFLLPTVNLLSGRAEESFWEMLRMNMGTQRQALLGVPRYVVLLVGLTSILPVLFMGIRWPAQFGDISAAGNALTNLMTHVIHGVFLVACLYVAFDPPFSPRHLADNRQMLPFYYLGALSVGYFSGYFLLLFAQRPRVKTWQRPSPLRLLINYAVVGLIVVAMVGVPVGLFLQNRPEILLTSNRHLQTLGDASASSLPKGKAVILSDDPARLYALESALARSGNRQPYVLVHSSSLSQPAYHRYLFKRYPEQWPQFLAERPLKQRIDPKTIVEAVIEMTKSSRLFYLHPSFGYYFEFFYSTPLNMVFELHQYDTNQIAGATLTPEQVASNHAFWQQLYQEKLGPLTMETDLEKVANNPPDRTLFLIAAMYSRTMDAVGVAFQRAGALKEAGMTFQNALSLNAYNPFAFVNLHYNRTLQLGETKSEPAPGTRERLIRYGYKWNAILNENGPVDEPNSCFLLAEAMARGHNYRQAAQQLLRTVEYQTTNFQAHIGLATMLVRANLPALGLDRLNIIRQSFPELNLPQQLALVQAEAWALAKQNRLAEAIKILEKTIQEHPSESGPYGTLAEIYIDAGRVSDALLVFENQIAQQPQNTGAKINYHALQIQNKQYGVAIEGLTRFLQENPTDGRGRLNRAIAYFLNGDLDRAEADYRVLEDGGSPPFPVYYGLGEINFRRGRQDEAKEYYKLYLETATRETPEYRKIEERVKAWDRGLFK